jgi:mannose-6-phosphate isomerase-like protein (cupin superfamily)
MSKEGLTKSGSATTYAPTPETTQKLLEILKRGQHFHYQHARGDEDYAAGFRSYARYRDLGVGKATNGLVQAHLVRLIGQCTDEVRKEHSHDTAFQMVYVLRGWEKIQAEGHEPVTMRVGSVWIQPPNIRHTVLDYSEDLEVIEIILPAEFDTQNT